MAVALHGDISQVEALLEAGADVDIRAYNTWTARDFAQHGNHAQTRDVLDAYKYGNVSKCLQYC